MNLYHRGTYYENTPTSFLESGVIFDTPFLLFSSSGRDSCFIPTVPNGSNRWEVLLEYAKELPNVRYVLPTARELLTPYNHVFDEIRKGVEALTYRGVSSDKILAVYNCYSEEQGIRALQEIGIKSIDFDYFTVEAALHHLQEYCDHRNSKDKRTGSRYGWDTQQRRKTTYKVEHLYDFLALVGKPGKLMRAEFLTEAYNRNWGTRSIISSLTDEKGAFIAAQALGSSSSFSSQNIEKALLAFQGSVDNVLVDSPSDPFCSNYYGYPYDCSLYEKTFMSIVLETNSNFNTYPFYSTQFFITEKTTRMLENMHPFVILSTDGFLKNLKTLGYETFYEIIDESYDTVDSLSTKISIALNSAERLIEEKNNPLIKEIVSHNFFLHRKRAYSEIQRLYDFLNTN